MPNEPNRSFHMKRRKATIAPQSSWARSMRSRSQFVDLTAILDVELLDRGQGTLGSVEPGHNPEWLFGQGCRSLWCPCGRRWLCSRHGQLGRCNNHSSLISWLVQSTKLIRSGVTLFLIMLTAAPRRFAVDSCHSCRLLPSFSIHSWWNAWGWSPLFSWRPCKKS